MTCFFACSNNKSASSPSTIRSLPHTLSSPHHHPFSIGLTKIPRLLTEFYIFRWIFVPGLFISWRWRQYAPLKRLSTSTRLHGHIYISPNAAFFLIKNMKSRFSWKSLRQEIVYFVKWDSCAASNTFQICVSTSCWSVNMLASCGFHYCSHSFIVTQFISSTRRHPSWMSSNCDQTMQYCADSGGGTIVTIVLCVRIVRFKCMQMAVKAK
jgi:hypothetical protein